MMVKPTVKELLKKVDNRFELVTITAKRARQIAAGDTVLINTREEAPVTIAAEEIAEGKVNAKQEESQEEVSQDVGEDVGEEIN